MKKVVLVDQNNKEIGTEEKIKAHKEGLLHRAFSVFIFNSKGEMLLQRRSTGKYHSGGLWSNAVCSHPRVGEDYEKAIHRRTKEEMGFDCNMKKVADFTYKAELDNGLIENEHDTVFVGEYNGDVAPNPDEAMDYKWASLEEIKEDVVRNPNNYSPWFKIALSKINYFKNYERANINNFRSS